MKKSLLFGGLAFSIVLMAVFLALPILGASSIDKTDSKVGYIDNKSVFDEFEGKKERAVLLLDMENKQRFLIDSLSLLVQTFEKQNPKDIRVKIYKDQLTTQQTEFEIEYQKVSDEYTAQVWTQLNQFIEDFGKEKGYALIHGGTGSGSVMYVDTNINITKQVIEYVNQKYQGH